MVNISYYSCFKKREGNNVKKITLFPFSCHTQKKGNELHSIIPFFTSSDSYYVIHRINKYFPVTNVSGVSTFLDCIDNGVNTFILYNLRRTKREIFPKNRKKIKKFLNLQTVRNGRSI